MRGLVLGAVLLLGGIAGLIVLVRASAEEPAGPYWGTSLGMTAFDVREQFAGARVGHWTHSTSNKVTQVLSWTRAGESDLLPLSISFELHDGVVVVIRAVAESLDPLARGTRVERSTFSIVVREPSDDGRVRLSVFARGCSDHAAELAQILGDQDETGGLDQAAVERGR